MTDYQREADAARQRTNRQRFKTAEGHCYLLEDKIVITRDRKMALAKAFELSRLRYIKSGIYLISATFSLTYAFLEFANSRFYLAAAYLSLGIGFALLSKSEIAKSKVTVINLKDIINVQFYSARIGRKHSFFELVYSKGLRVLYTEVVLPAPKNSGRPNTQKALALMDGLLK